MTIAEAAAIVGLGAAVAGGDAERLRAALDEAVDLVPATDVEEYLLQTYLFSGFPRVINAFYTWQGWTARRGVRRTAGPVEAIDPGLWRARGERLCRRVYGANYEALQRRLERLHPALAEWTLLEGYGKVLGRPGPDPARRELAAIGALIAMGAERQLASHLKGAVNLGVEPHILEAAVWPSARAWQREALVGKLLEAGR